jgi:hypothetical protein
VENPKILQLAYPIHISFLLFQLSAANALGLAAAPNEACKDGPKLAL